MKRRVIYTNYESLTLGFLPFGVRDGGLHGPHPPSSLHRQAEVVYLHLGESRGSEVTIWAKGELVISEDRINRLVY